MVEEEFPDLNETEITRNSATLTNLKRGKSGYWSVTATIQIDIRLPDGRSVKCDREVTFKESQRGRKPHPNQFGKAGRK